MSTPSKSPGAAAPHAAPQAAAAAAGMEKSISDIPHNDLVHLCLKMNKKIQANEAKFNEMSKRNKRLIAERSSLFGIMKNVININSYVVHSVSVLDESVDIDTETLTADCVLYAKEREELQSKLLLKDHELATCIVQSDAKYEQLQLQLKSEQLQLQLKSFLSSNGDTTSSSSPSKESESAWLEEKQRLQSEVIDLSAKLKIAESESGRLSNESSKQKNEISSLEKVLSDQTAKLGIFQKENEKVRSSYEEKVLFLQMQLNGLKSKEDSKDKEDSGLKTQLESSNVRLQRQTLRLEETNLALKTSKEFSQALQAKINELEPQVEKSQGRLKELERNSHATTILLAEKDALIKSLRGDCKRILEEKEEGSKRQRELEEFRIRAEGQLLKLQQSHELAQQLTVQLEEKTSLITRLHTEAQTSERNHAMRTAMLATVEAQLSSIKSESDSKDEQMRVRAAQHSEVIDKLKDSESRAAKSSMAAAARIREVESAMRLLESAQIAKIDTISRDSDAAMDSLKKDFARKSSLARQLLSEKEEECRVLQKKVSELQEEIESGSPSEKKIFEYAQKQSQRELTHNIHTDTREVAFRQMQLTLASRDLDLARAQQMYAELLREVVDLRRNMKREDVNMDYLKNIVIQFMTLPAQSSERSSLVPVIATLLQFNTRELVDVQKTLTNPYTSMTIKEVVRRSSVAPSPSSPLSFTPASTPAKSREGSIDIKVALNGVTPPVYTNSRDSLSSQEEVLSN